MHLYGHVVPFESLQRWRASGLLVVEDAAEAHLATWEGRYVGFVGHAACFSFYPGKNLGALGDGGAVVSQDASLVDEVRRLRDHGRVTKYSHDEIGWCSRLDGLQAGVLGVKLCHLPEWTAARQALAVTYAESLPEGTVVPWSEGAVHHLFVVRSVEREGVAERLRDADVGCGIHYPVTLSQQPSLRAHAVDTPSAERAAAEVLSLPMDPLMTLGEVGTVTSALGGS